MDMYSRVRPASPKVEEGVQVRFSSLGSEHAWMRRLVCKCLTSASLTATPLNQPRDPHLPNLITAVRALQPQLLQGW